MAGNLVWHNFGPYYKIQLDSDKYDVKPGDDSAIILTKNSLKILLLIDDANAYPLAYPRDDDRVKLLDVFQRLIKNYIPELLTIGKPNFPIGYRHIPCIAGKDAYDIRFEFIENNATTGYGELITSWSDNSRKVFILAVYPKYDKETKDFIDKLVKSIDIKSMPAK